MFLEYETLRHSGLVNMLGARQYLGWEKHEFVYLIQHYAELAQQYNDVMDEAHKAGEAMREEGA